MCDRFIYAVGQATNSNVGSVKEMLRINPDSYRDGSAFLGSFLLQKQKKGEWWSGDHSNALM